jgi:hypothetical protein
MTSKVLAGIAAVAVSIAAAGAAFAFEAEAGSTKRALKTRIEPLLIIKDSPTQYLISGKLISKRAGCRFRRTVRLHVLHPDNTDTVVSSTKTKSGVGLFNFRVDLLPSDDVYVTTPAKEFVTKSGKRIHCATGRSILSSVPT